VTANNSSALVLSSKGSPGVGSDDGALAELPHDLDGFGRHSSNAISFRSNVISHLNRLRTVHADGGEKRREKAVKKVAASMPALGVYLEQCRRFASVAKYRHAEGVYMTGSI
jgi:hypothetical protein